MESLVSFNISGSSDIVNRQKSLLMIANDLQRFEQKGAEKTEK